MTIDQLLETILPTLPNATLSEDSDGQIVINTGLEESDNGKLQAFGSWTEEQINKTFGDVALRLVQLRKAQNN